VTPDPNRKLPGTAYFAWLLTDLLPQLPEQFGGAALYVFDYQSYRAFTESGDQLAAKLLETMNVDGLDGFVVVGHSMGGLVARSAAQSLEGAGATQVIRGIISLATPHLGSPLPDAPIAQMWSVGVATPGGASLVRGVGRVERVPLVAYAGDISGLLEHTVHGKGYRLTYDLLAERGYPENDGAVPVASATPSEFVGATLGEVTLQGTLHGYDHSQMGYSYGASLDPQGLFSSIRADIARLLRGAEATNFVEISAGISHSCGRMQSGAVYCWGNNFAGKLGDGTTTDRLVPTLVAGGNSFVEISSGSQHSCGRTENGAVYCWGYNTGGQLGDGTTSDRLVPTLVTGGISFVEISAGAFHSCGRTQNGAVYCWGDNTEGEVGDGTTSFWNSRPVPTLVTGGTSFVEINAGGFHSCGRTQNGAVYCWGDNPEGEVGDGTSYNFRPVPTLVTGGTSFVEINAGGFHSCGRTQDGSVYCWGRNDEGQLGDGTTTDRLVPTLVAGGISFVDISAGGLHSCGRTQDGAVYCWGYNGRGQLGDGTTSGRLVPTLVAGGLSFVEISAGFNHSCGRTQVGAVYCWGSNFGGELGDGTTTDRPVPTLVRSP
jgi:alpha-tubulin suppressor-like RCC1 family protein